MWNRKPISVLILIALLTNTVAACVQLTPTPTPSQQTMQQTASTDVQGEVRFSDTLSGFEVPVRVQDDSGQFLEGIEVSFNISPSNKILILSRL